MKNFAYSNVRRSLVKAKVGFWKIRVERIAVGGSRSGSSFKPIAAPASFKADTSKKNSFFTFHAFNCDIMFRARLAIVRHESKSSSFSQLILKRSI